MCYTHVSNCIYLYTLYVFIYLYMKSVIRQLPGEYVCVCVCVFVFVCVCVCVCA